jgi:hypothetical protein
MRLPRLRPRLRLRTLLIAVAVAGVMLGAWQMWKRREYCRIRVAVYSRYAEKNRLRAEGYAASAREYRRQAARMRGHDEFEAERQVQLARMDEILAKSYGDEAAWYARLATPYRDVARCPWLPLPPEPDYSDRPSALPHLGPLQTSDEYLKP